MSQHRIWTRFVHRGHGHDRNEASDTYQLQFAAVSFESDFAFLILRPIRAHIEHGCRVSLEPTRRFMWTIRCVAVVLLWYSCQLVTFAQIERMISANDNPTPWRYSANGVVTVESRRRARPVETRRHEWRTLYGATRFERKRRVADSGAAGACDSRALRSMCQSVMPISDTPLQVVWSAGSAGHPRRGDRRPGG
jgi:hypothetical protein